MILFQNPVNWANFTELHFSSPLSLFPLLSVWQTFRDHNVWKSLKPCTACMQSHFFNCFFQAVIYILSSQLFTKSHEDSHSILHVNLYWTDNFNCQKLPSLMFSIKYTVHFKAKSQEFSDQLSTEAAGPTDRLPSIQWVIQSRLPTSRGAHSHCSTEMLT